MHGDMIEGMHGCTDECMYTRMLESVRGKDGCI